MTRSRDGGCLRMKLASGGGQILHRTCACTRPVGTGPKLLLSLLISALSPSTEICPMGTCTVRQRTPVRPRRATARVAWKESAAAHMQHVPLRPALVHPVAANAKDALGQQFVRRGGRLHYHHVAAAVLVPEPRPFVEQHQVPSIRSTCVEGGCIERPLTTDSVPTYSVPHRNTGSQGAASPATATAAAASESARKLSGEVR